MNISVRALRDSDRANWEPLYHGYAEFYKVPMNDEILETVWGWIFDDDETFYCLVAEDSSGKLIGLMHFREMPSPVARKKSRFS